MSEFEPTTVEELRGEQELPHAAEGAESAATHDGPDLEATRGVPADTETPEGASDVEPQKGVAELEAREDGTDMEDANVADTPDVAAAAGTREVTHVERALEELDRLAERDLADHPDAYQRIHADLRDALAAIDDA